VRGSYRISRRPEVSLRLSEQTTGNDEKLISLPPLYKEIKNPSKCDENPQQGCAAGAAFGDQENNYGNCGY
jgi:hypothetical protein